MSQPGPVRFGLIAVDAPSTRMIVPAIMAAIPDFRPALVEVAVVVVICRLLSIGVLVDGYR
jgi:hypothetical protein